MVVEQDAEEVGVVVGVEEGAGVVAVVVGEVTRDSRSGGEMTKGREYRRWLRT